MSRFVYTFCFYLIMPAVLLRMLWRSRRAPEYRKRWGERFGFVPRRSRAMPSIWIHVVSVGESLAAMPLMKSLLQRYPTHQLIVTTTTPTGSERVRVSLGGAVVHVYCCYDLPDCIARFLDRMQPDLAIMMETELWPNTVAACRKKGIPVALINGRLSERSAAGYARVASLANEMFSSLSVVAAQTGEDGERFQRLGVRPECLQVTGNLKFDLSPDEGLQRQADVYRRRWGAGERPVLLAASTHDGEEDRLLQALSLLLPAHPDLLLVIVPRHPERFEGVYRLSQKTFSVQRHSDALPVPSECQVLIGDTMGELMALIGAADMVFMGGTWVDRGGHNFIEPASLGKPQFGGHSLFNFKQVSQWLLEAGALTLVDNPQQLAQAVSALIADPQKAEVMGEAGSRVAHQNRGALEKVLVQLATQLGV